MFHKHSFSRTRRGDPVIPEGRIESILMQPNRFELIIFLIFIEKNLVIYICVCANNDRDSMKLSAECPPVAGKIGMAALAAPGCLQLQHCAPLLCWGNQDWNVT